MGEFYDVKNTAVQMVEELYFALNNTWNGMHKYKILCLDLNCFIPYSY